MKVNNIIPVFFKGVTSSTNPVKDTGKNKEIKELSNITPDFAVKTPQKYKKISEAELANGTKIYSYKLENGHKITIIPMAGSPAIVKNYVNVGSMNETDDIKGISHFLEHMAFNGTDGNDGHKKLGHGDSFKKIDELGGWTNASTSYAITDYVNSTPLLDNKDIEEQIKIIAAMTEDLSLTDAMIEKEKSPVCSEINMILDDPQTIAIDQTVRTLFNIQSNADEMVAGSTNHIQNLDRNKVKEYYDKYYTPDNMNLVITGDVDPDKIIEIVSREFKSNKKTQGKRYEEKLVPINNTVRKDFISEKATSTDIVLGFAGPASNNSKDRIILDIISEYVDRVDVGIDKELKRLNSYMSLQSEKISTNPNNPTLLLLNANCADKNSEEVLKIIFDKLSALKAPDEGTLQLLKEGILQSYKDTLEYSLNVNTMIGQAVLNENLDILTNYENILNSITTKDIKNFIDNYLNLKKSALTVVHPQVDIDEVNQNYVNAQKLSFKGKRQPLQMDKVSVQTLNNNYRVAIQKTPNDNITFIVKLNYDKQDWINPAAKEVLAQIYTMGTANTTEDEFKAFNENNNIDLYAGVSDKSLNIVGYSSAKNFGTNASRAYELLNCPRINEETFRTAVGRIKDTLAREKDTADSLFTDYESQFNDNYTSKSELKDSLNKLTIEDVIKLHEYIISNAEGCIVMNAPEADDAISNEALDIFGQYNQVKPHTYKLNNVYSKTEKPLVITKSRNVSQADIKQTFKFPLEDNVREKVICKIMNTILSSSNSIGLFNSLREKDHLAYSVHSTFKTSEDTGYISLDILTTTDNKETGEISYDNLQKSINGFNRQIGLLLDSKYTDEDFESAKRILKAKLLNKEGVFEKVMRMQKTMNTKEGIDYENQMYNMIDSISRDEIDEYAYKIFANKPVYTIVASEDTLEANKNYLENL